MPSRIVREGIISSPRINALTLGAETLYRRLMSIADDYGRFFGSVMNLRVSCFPTNPDRFREKEVGKWLDELLRGENPLVKTYCVGGITYLEIQEFGQQIRGRSKFPDPPWFESQQLSDESAKQMLEGPVSKCEANVQPSRMRMRSRISESESKEESAPETGALSPKKSRAAKKRTTEEIRAALGAERLPWWEAFWKVYPCHEGLNPAMDTYERKVKTRDLAVKIYNGAKAYGEQIAEKRRVEANVPVKYGQGWLNDERWEDEISTRIQPSLQGTIYKTGDYDDNGNWVEA